MPKNKKSRFIVGDLAVLSHSVCGLLENMIVRVSNVKKGGNKEIEVTSGEKHILIKKKYLLDLDPKYLSSKFNINDKAKLKRHYERFIKDSIVTIISNYLGTKNKIVVQDERGIIGLVPESILTKQNE